MDFLDKFESFIGVNFWTALFVLLNTLAIYFVAKKFLIGPVMKIVSDRQKEIDDLYSDAGNAKTEAESLRSEYEQKLSSAYTDSERIVKEAVLRGQAREEELVRTAHEEAAAIMDKAYADIELEKKKARDELKGEISGIAVDIASKVVEREIKAEDHAAFIDEFISGIGDAS